MADARPFHWEYTPDPVAREVFRIEGGRPLAGTVRISGAKNAALKLLAAAVLTGERCRFTNVPEIEDVRVMVATLVDLGVVVEHPAPGVYEVASGDVDWLFVPLEAAAKMHPWITLDGGDDDFRANHRLNMAAHLDEARTKSFLMLESFKPSPQ